MSTLEREMERMGWSEPPDQKLPRSISRKVLEEGRRAKVAQAEAQRIHQEALAALRAAKSLQETPKPKFKPRKVWIGYGVGFGVLVLLCAVIGVTMARENLKTTTLQSEQLSNAAMVCIDGDGVAANGENFWTWLTGGHSFQCKNWETLDAKKEKRHAAESARALDREQMARRAAGYEQD